MGKDQSTNLHSTTRKRIPTWTNIKSRIFILQCENECTLMQALMRKRMRTCANQKGSSPT